MRSLRIRFFLFINCIVFLLFCSTNLFIYADADPYWVVGASLESQIGLGEIVDKFASIGEQAVAVEVVVAEKTYFRVCIGPFSDRASASVKLEYVRKNGIPDAWLVSMPVSSVTAKPTESTTQVGTNKYVNIGTYKTLNKTDSIKIGSDVMIKAISLAQDQNTKGILANQFVVKPGVRPDEIVVEYGNNMSQSFTTPLEIAMETPLASPASKFIWIVDKLQVYRGKFKLIRNADGGITVVNVLDVEDYLRGVLVAEIGATSPLEALCAQAIVARSEVTGKSRHSADGYDFCTSTHCQVYIGAASEYKVSILDEVTKKTKGILIYFNGSVITEAKYSTTCGGLTDNCSEVWGSNLPYLVSTWCVADKGLFVGDMRDESKLTEFIDSVDTKSLCYQASGFRWSKTYSETELSSLLAKVAVNKGIKIPGNLVSFSIIKRSQRGSACEMNVVFSGGSFNISTEYNIREALGGSTVIKSGVFVIRKYVDKNTVYYELRGSGYGHGVGMCQNGARQMAKLGASYADILALYFNGTELRRN